MPYTANHSRPGVSGEDVVLARVRRPPAPPLLAYGAVTALWGLSVSLSAVFEPTKPVHQLALTAHILSLAVGFGAVTMVDWYGLLWIGGRRDLREMTRLAQAAAPLIWGGSAGLLLSGALLHPDLDRPLTWLKLAAVLVVLLNGVSVAGSVGYLATRSPAERLRHLADNVRRRMIASAAVSQLCWWTVIAVGLLTSAQRG